MEKPRARNWDAYEAVLVYLLHATVLRRVKMHGCEGLLSWHNTATCDGAGTRGRSSGSTGLAKTSIAGHMRRCSCAESRTCSPLALFSGPYTCAHSSHQCLRRPSCELLCVPLGGSRDTAIRKSCNRFGDGSCLMIQCVIKQDRKSLASQVSVLERPSTVLLSTIRREYPSLNLGCALFR